MRFAAAGGPNQVDTHVFVQRRTVSPVIRKSARVHLSDTGASCSVLTARSHHGTPFTIRCAYGVPLHMIQVPLFLGVVGSPLAASNGHMTM